MSSPRVRFFFDFISPYSYLASQLIQKRPELSAIDFEIKPVVFGSILAKRQAVGPGEIPSRRRQGLVDVLLLADHHGVSLEGPPTHPFNSIYALRSVLGAPVELRAALTHRYFSICWGEGRSLEDLDVLKGCLEELGIEQDPEEEATRRENRQALKANTNEALELGAWGVPTFVVGDILLFGHDRLDLLAAYLGGHCSYEEHKLVDLLARPQPGRIT